jgi:hypothetical protein
VHGVVEGLLFAVIVFAIASRAYAVQFVEFAPDKPASAAKFAIHPVTGEIYAAEVDRTAVYDATGNLLRSFGAIEPQAAFLVRSVQVNPQGQVLVRRGNAIQLYDVAGNLEGTINQHSDGGNISPARPALAPDGRVFLTRLGGLGQEVEVFSPQGAFERSFLLPAGDQGPRQGVTMDFGPDGLLYVASDRGPFNNRVRGIEVLDAAGVLQRNITLGTLPSAGAPQLTNTLGFRIAPNGNLLLSRDAVHIDVYDPQGQALHAIYGGLQLTTDFDVTPDGGLALQEFPNGSRIRVFTPEEAVRLTTDRPLLHFVDGPFGWARWGNSTHPGGEIGVKLDLVGIGSTNALSETAAEMFRVPGEIGAPQTVEVTWHRVIPSMDAFGIFDPTAITVDPVANPREYAAQA